MPELVEGYKFLDISLVANPIDPIFAFQWPGKKICEKLVEEKCEKFIKDSLPKITKYKWMNTLWKI